MNTTPDFSKILGLTVLFVSLLWIIKSAETLFQLDLIFMAVFPQTVQGALGIVTAPLIHGSFIHLFHNTLPLLLLLSALFYGYPNSAWRLIAMVWIISGVGVWLFARHAPHLGASGITHGLFFYIFVVSLFRRDKRSVVLMMIAFFMYGGMILSIFPREEGISFEYHFWGAFAGTLGAILWHKLDPQLEEKKYSWEDEEEPESESLNEQWKDIPDRKSGQ